jgi:hypothetical protein
VGRTKKERIRSMYIMGELNMVESQTQIERIRLRWSGHVKKWMGIENLRDYCK